MNKAETIEIRDIALPKLGEGDTSIVFQRHGKYERNPELESAGSVYPESVQTMARDDRAIFDKLFGQGEVYVLFTASDTKYAGKGQRSMETAHVAQVAAIESLKAAGFDPKEHIINLNDDYNTASSPDSGLDIRPLPGIREPQIFSPKDKAYLIYLQEKYGYADPDAKVGLAPRAWAAHEMDSEQEAREQTGTEGQEDLIVRTERTLQILERYARLWHENNPGKRLVIWMASHYDTISPIVKKAEGVLRNSDGTLSDAYQPIDYGGGVVITIPANPESERTLETRKGKLPLELGTLAARDAVTRLDLPNY